MTILIVRVVSQGIVFGADRNISESRTKLGSGRTVIVINGQSQRPKVLRWPNKKALIGYAGVASIGGIPTDEWLYDFIGENINFPSFDVLANKLRTAVEEQRRNDEGSTDPDALLIHLAGFEKLNSNNVPVVWYIRNAYNLKNGHYGDIRKEFICSDAFKEAISIPSEKIRDELAKYERTNNPFGFQQGLDLGTFNILNAFLNGAFEVISKIHPDQPTPQTLGDWEKHVKMSILTYAAFFETYNDPGEQYVGGGADVVSLEWPS